MNFKNKRAEILNGKISLLNDVECLQKMSKISSLVLVVLSNMHLLFNASGETVAKGRKREGKCKFIYIGTIHLFLHNKEYFLINIEIEFEITAQPVVSVFMNISDCMQLLK